MDKGQKEGEGGYYDKQKQQFYYGGWNHNQRFGFGICFYNIQEIKSKDGLIVQWKYD